MTHTIPGFALSSLSELTWPSIGRVLSDPERHWPREILERPMVRQDIAGRPVVMLADPDAFRTILVDRAPFFPRAPEQGRLLRRFLGASIMTAPPDGPGPQRRSFAKVFGAATGANRVPAMVAAAKSLIRQWGESASVDVVAEATGLSLDVMWRCLIDDANQEHPDPVVQDMAAKLAAHPFGLSDLAGLMILLTARLAALSADEVDQDLSGLREAGGTLAAHEAVLDNARLFLQAGHHTISAAIAWSLLMLAGDPISQERARVEIDQVLGDQPLRIDQLAQLTALREIVDETLRLFPPSALPRLAGEDLVVGGERVPAGSCVILNFFALHRHRRWWRDPDRFEPQRFASDAGELRHPQAYLPFGSGPHRCIAANFAMVELMTVLAVILREVHLETLSDAAPTAIHRLITMPGTGRSIRIRHREGVKSDAR